MLLQRASKRISVHVSQTNGLVERTVESSIPVVATTGRYQVDSERSRTLQALLRIEPAERAALVLHRFNALPGDSGSGKGGPVRREFGVTGTLRWYPRLMQDGLDPLEVFVSDGRRLAFIRPSWRTTIQVPKVANELIDPLPPELVLKRKARYARRTCGPRAKIGK